MWVYSFGSPVVPVPLLEKIVLSLLNYIGTSVQNQLTMYVFLLWFTPELVYLGCCNKLPQT